MKCARKRFKIFAVLLACFVGWPVAAPFLAERLIVEKPLARADAILVLGGSATYVERTRKAAELYRNGVAPKIYLTDDGGRGGWSPAEQTNLKFVEMARRRLISEGVPAENIEILDRAVVSGTIDEARLFAEIATAGNLKSVLLVTSAYHTGRALWTFEKVSAGGPRLEVGIESPPPGIQTPPPNFWWLSPAGWQMVAGEYIKIAYYRAFY